MATDPIPFRSPTSQPPSRAAVQEVFRLENSMTGFTIRPADEEVTLAFLLRRDSPSR